MDHPLPIDRHTGYRRYTTTQIPTAQIFRCFRDLDMPVDVVAKVLAAPDIDARNELIAAHLSRHSSAEAISTEGAVKGEPHHRHR